MEVALDSPIGALDEGIPVRHLAMYPRNLLVTWAGEGTMAITARGKARAEQLLIELYQSAPQDAPSRQEDI